jgi:hypothetical protein
MRILELTDLATTYAPISGMKGRKDLPSVKIETAIALADVQAPVLGALTSLSWVASPLNDNISTTFASRIHVQVLVDVGDLGSNYTTKKCRISLVTQRHRHTSPKPGHPFPSQKTNGKKDVCRCWLANTGRL